MLPTLVYENAVRLFSFYHDGCMHQGISYRQRLYRMVRCFKSDDRSQAYVVACQFACQGIETIITSSERCYRVWTEIRADAEGSGKPVSLETQFI